MSVLDTVVIKFGEEVESSTTAIIELDEEANAARFSSGVETPIENEPIYLLFNADPVLEIKSYMVSSGRLEILGEKLVTMSSLMFFPTVKDKLSVSPYPTDIVVSKVYGTEFDIVRTEDPRQIVASKDCCVGDVDVSYNCISMRLDPPTTSLLDDETWPVGLTIWVGKK